MADVVHAASGGGGGGGGGGGEVLLRVKLPNGRVTSVRAAPADCVRTGVRVSICHPLSLVLPPRSADAPYAQNFFKGRRF